MKNCMGFTVIIFFLILVLNPMVLATNSPVPEPFQRFTGCGIGSVEIDEGIPRRCWSKNCRTRRRSSPFS